MSERQYIDLYEQARQTIFDHAPEAMNAVRDDAFEPSRHKDSHHVRWNGISIRMCRSSLHLIMG